MKVVVEGSPFENRQQLGVWRYLYEVLGRLAGQAEIVLRVGERPTQPVPAGVTVVIDRGVLAAERKQVVRRARRLIGSLRVPSALRGADVYHSTFFGPAWRGGPPSVVTVYDMVPEVHYPICGPWAPGQIARKRAAINAAARCVCISQATADELVRFHPGVGETVRVIHLGEPGASAPGGTKTPGADAPGPPFVLYVGHRTQYKNFSVILDAMARPGWPPGVALRVAGQPAADEDERYVRASQLSGRVAFLGRLSDEALAAEYAAASAVVFPSLQEGFGLPLVEAQAAGCPVACSDIPVFREVAGPAAEYFDPRSPDAVAAAVARLQDPAARKALIDAGRENVRRFSWDRAAQATLAVYAEAAAGSRP